MEAARVLVRSLVLALVTAMGPFIVASSPAEALVQPCTVSYPGSSMAINPNKVGEDHSLSASNLLVADSRVVADLDVSVDLTHQDASALAVHLLGPKTNGLLPNVRGFKAGDATGAVNGLYTFDDEAATKTLTGANPSPGNYLPDPELPARGLEGGPANGTGTQGWSLWILNRSTQSGTVRAWTLTLTYATCDSDGDGVEETADNCPTLVNDQANLDGDAAGDACDLDDDADSLADAADGCPAVASSTSSGCPTATRTATLSNLAKKKRIVLTTRSAVAACRPGAEMTLWRKRRGKDLPLVVASTSDAGRVRMKAPKKPGRYYATVIASYAAGVAECGSARSKTVRLKRRR